MRVAVHAARQHKKTGGVDDRGVGARVERAADGDDPAVIDQQVCGVVVHGRDDAAVENDFAGHGC